MSTPVLNNWRLVGGQGKATLGILVGEVAGHPSLADGWIATSAVAELAEDDSWARTASRRYRLAAPLPDDQPLPPQAKNALLNRMFRNLGTLKNEATLERVLNFVDKLSQAPVKHPG